MVGELLAQGRIEAVAAAVPAREAAMLPAIMEIARGAFVLSLHETFAVGAAACLVAVAAALLIQNPQPRAASVPRRLPDGATQAATAD